MSNEWVRSSAVIWEELGRDALLVDPQARTSWKLNHTATFIWKHCNGATGLKDLARALAKRSGSGLRHIERELADFCRRLEKSGLLSAEISRVSGAGAGSVACFDGHYETPSFAMRSLGNGPRRRPSPRGNSGPG